MKTPSELSDLYFSTNVDYNDFIREVQRDARACALKELYQTAIRCSTGHDISDHDSMFVIDHFAFTEAYNKLINEINRV